MYIYNQSENVLTAGNVSATGITLSNCFDKYINSKDTGTSTSVTLTFAGNIEHIVILNTNATFASVTTFGGTIIETNVTINTAETHNGIILKESGSITLDELGSITLKETASMVNNYTTSKNIYLGRYCQSVTLTGSENIEIGCLIGGSFYNYGHADKINNNQIELLISASDNLTLEEYMRTDDFYVVVADQDNAAYSSGIIQYGQASYGNPSIDTKTIDGIAALRNTIKVTK